MITVADASDVQVCTLCLICDNPIPVYSFNAPPRICDECKERIKKILYPPEIHTESECGNLLQHVGYSQEACGYEK